MTGWNEVGRIEDIPVLGARVVRRPGADIAVLRNGEDEIFALEDKSPHKGGPLSQGIVHGYRVTCPLHNWVLDLRSGETVGHDEGSVTTIPVRIEDGHIFMRPEGVTQPARSEAPLSPEV